MRTVGALEGGWRPRPRTVGRGPTTSSRRIRLPIRTDIPGSQTVGFHGAIRIHCVCPAGRMATPFLDWRSMMNTRPSTRRISKWARDIPLARTSIRMGRSPLRAGCRSRCGSRPTTQSRSRMNRELSSRTTYSSWPADTEPSSAGMTTAGGPVGGPRWRGGHFTVDGSASGTGPRPTRGGRAGFGSPTGRRARSPDPPR